MHIVQLSSSEVLERVINELWAGLSVSRAIALRMRRVEIYALVADFPDPSVLSDLHASWGGAHVTSRELALWIKRVYPDSVIVVELPFGNPLDSNLNVMSTGDEEYAICESGAPLAELEGTLQAAAPIVLYHVAVFRGVDVGKGGSPVDWLVESRPRVVAVIVGAYDADGYVVMQVE